MEWLLFVVAAAVIATVEAARRDAAWGGATKILASTGFLLWAWWSGAMDHTYGRWIFAGLSLSWIGDALLISRRTRWFLLGLVAFLVAHVLYTIAFTHLGVRLSLLFIAGLVGLAVYGVVHRWLLPHAGRMAPAVMAYMLAILVMVEMAVATQVLVVIVGAGLFAVSDLFVARQRFIKSTWQNRAIGLPLYYAGQLALGWSVTGV